MSALPFTSDTLDPTCWHEIKGFDPADITYRRGISHGPETGGRPEDADIPVVRIAFDRPDIHNAFRPGTVDELYRALDHAHQNSSVAAVILTGSGPPTRGGGYSFCSGGDRRVRGRGGYRYEIKGTDPKAITAQRREQIDPTRAGRLHIFEVQRLTRTMPKVVIAAVPGWAASGDHSLNVVADLSVVSIEYTAFMQMDANVGSFDAGYGSALLVRQTGDKRAHEIFFLAECYDAETAERWGVISRAVPHVELEETALEWVATIATKSPQVARMLKSAFNLADNGLAGQRVFAGKAMRMAYMTAEAQEGRDVFLEHRVPRREDYPYYH